MRVYSFSPDTSNEKKPARRHCPPWRPSSVVRELLLIATCKWEWTWVCLEREWHEEGFKFESNKTIKTLLICFSWKMRFFVTKTQTAKSKREKKSGHCEGNSSEAYDCCLGFSLGVISWEWHLQSWEEPSRLVLSWKLFTELSRTAVPENRAFSVTTVSSFCGLGFFSFCSFLLLLF